MNFPAGSHRGGGGSSLDNYTSAPIGVLCTARNSGARTAEATVSIDCGHFPGLLSFAGDRSRQQDLCVTFLKLDPPPIQCAARVNSLLTEQSSYNFNSVISFSTFTRRTAYSWQRVQFETTTPAHLLASSVPSETRTRQLVSRALTEAALGSGVAQTKWLLLPTTIMDYSANTVVSAVQCTGIYSNYNFKYYNSSEPGNNKGL